MGTWWWDRVTGLVTWDTALESIFGLESGGFKRTFSDWATLLHPDDRDQVIALVNRAITDQASYDVEHRILLADGTVRWLECRGRTYVDKDGHVGGTVGVVADVTCRKAAEEALRQSEERFRRIFECSHDAMLVLDPLADEVRAANPQAAELLGYSREELLKRRISELHAHELPKLQEFIANVLDARHKWAELTCTTRGDLDVPVEMSASLIELERRKCVIVAIRDIRERKRQEQVLRFLAEASEALLFSLDHSEMLERVTHLAISRLADFSAVHLVGEGDKLKRITVAHVDPAKEELARRIADLYPLELTDAHPLMRVLSTGAPEVHAEIPDALYQAIAQDEEHLDLLRELSLRSMLLVPLKGRGQTFGVISFATAESGRTYGPDDLHLAEELTRRAALALDNARLYQERNHIARTLQNSLLPSHLPEIPSVQIEPRYRPTGEGIEVGGDFYDVFATNQDSWAIVIGDVCGKGPEAAALTGLARHTLRAVAWDFPTPTEVLGRLNHALYDQGDGERFCTVCYIEAKPDPSGLRLSVCCAGHHLPFVIRSNGRVEKVGSPGTLLGVFTSLDLTEQLVDLQPGDALVLYTDGLIESTVESKDDDEEGLVLQLHDLAGAEAKLVADEIMAWRERTAQSRDDLAVMVVRFVPVKEQSLQLSLTPIPESARACRLALVQLTANLGPEMLETAQLLISEIVTNSLRHAGLGPGERILIEAEVSEGVLRVGVRDKGRGFSPDQHSPPAELRESGWGLQLVEHLAHRWGVISHKKSTEVWFELDLQSPKSPRTLEEGLECYS